MLRLGVVIDIPLEDALWEDEDVNRLLLSTLEISEKHQDDSHTLPPSGAGAHVAPSAPPSAHTTRGDVAPDGRNPDFNPRE